VHFYGWPGFCVPMWPACGLHLPVMFERKNPWRVPLAEWRIAPDDWTSCDFTIRETERFVVSFRSSETLPRTDADRRFLYFRCGKTSGAFPPKWDSPKLGYVAGRKRSRSVDRVFGMRGQRSNLLVRPPESGCQDLRNIA
jgi:hypothetical protein